jgi:hypothetical protein
MFETAVGNVEYNRVGLSRLDALWYSILILLDLDGFFL